MTDSSSILRGLARTLWRHLPVKFRRRLARGLLMASAPSLPQPDSASLEPDAPWIVIGFLSSASGLGQAARLAHLAFERQGHRVYGVDLSRRFFEMDGTVGFPFEDARTHEGPARVLININAPYMPYVFRLLGSRFLRGKHVTAYWAWELETAPPVWRDGLRFAHEIAVPSQFVAGAIKGLGWDKPVRIAPHPVALEAAPAVPFRTAPISPAAPFTIVSSLNAASGFERKNPLALVRTFRAAFGGDPAYALRLHVTNLEHYPPGRAALLSAISGDPTITLSTSPRDRADFLAWFGAPDLFASLHRAEGFGLGLAESLCRGIPVLATDWSANAEWVDEDVGYPVRARLVPVRDPQAKYEDPAARWAAADETHAAARLREAAQDVAGRLRRSQTAVRRAAEMFGRFEP